MIIGKIISRISDEDYILRVDSTDHKLSALIDREVLLFVKDKVPKNVELTGQFFSLAKKILFNIHYPFYSRDEIYEYFYADFIEYLKAHYLPIVVNENGQFVKSLTYCTEEELKEAINRIKADFSGPPYNFEL